MLDLSIEVRGRGTAPWQNPTSRIRLFLHHLPAIVPKYHHRSFRRLFHRRQSPRHDRPQSLIRYRQLESQLLLHKLDVRRSLPTLVSSKVLRCRLSVQLQCERKVRQLAQQVRWLSRHRTQVRHSALLPQPVRSQAHLLWLIEEIWLRRDAAREPRLACLHLQAHVWLRDGNKPEECQLG